VSTGVAPQQIDAGCRPLDQPIAALRSHANSRWSPPAAVSRLPS